MFNLRPMLAEAHAAIESNLADMHARGHYILGPQTAAFEREFAIAVGGAEAVGVGSGTSALELCLRDAGVSDSSAEVIVPAMTSMFTAHAVLAAGARVRVADVSPDSLLLTPESLERAWSPETRAVIAVHLYGQPCDLPAIAAFCQRHGAVLIQDACQAHGARFQGRPLTDFSPYCAYSFYPTKNLGALGDGGAIVTSNTEISGRLRQLRDGGRLGDQISRMPGVNSRLDEMHACYLRAFLPYLPEWNERRRMLAGLYASELQDFSAVELLAWSSDSVHHLLAARCHGRDALREHLLAQGIQSGIHYPIPIHEQPGIAPYCVWSDEPRVASRAAREIVSLPIGPHLSAEQVTQVAEAVRTFRCVETHS